MDSSGMQASVTESIQTTIPLGSGSGIGKITGPQRCMFSHSSGICTDGAADGDAGSTGIAVIVGPFVGPGAGLVPSHGPHLP